MPPPVSRVGANKEGIPEASGVRPISFRDPYIQPCGIGGPVDGMLSYPVYAISSKGLHSDI